MFLFVNIVVVVVVVGCVCVGGGVRKGVDMQGIESNNQDKNSLQTGHRQQSCVI